MDFHLVCSLILWRAGLGLLMGKFVRFCLQQGSDRLEGYYCFMFLFSLNCTFYAVVS